MTTPPMQVPGALRARFRRLSERKIPVRIVSLSAALLGALIISVALMVNDLMEHQDRAERANDRFHMFEVAAGAHRHFSEMRYWLTDLSVSMLTLSERRAQQARDALAADLMAIEDFAPERSEEHTYELQSLMRISYAGFCLEIKNR